MRILAIGAHPDDLEIFCYGLLAACKSRGDELHLAVATDGAAGTVAGRDDRLAVRRADETRTALTALGVPVLLGLPDGAAAPPAIAVLAGVRAAPRGAAQRRRVPPARSRGRLRRPRRRVPRTLPRPPAAGAARRGGAPGRLVRP